MTLQLLNRWAPRGDCLLCGASGVRAVCPGCEAGLPWAQLAGDGVVAAFAYRFPIDRLVQRFKAGHDFAAGRWLAERLAERVAGEDRPDLVVAPPTPRARLVERGLNPALHLARHVARALRLPCEAGVVERVRDTPPQRALHRRERRANLRGAFRCRASLAGRHVALVDDVVTTGATAEEIAQVLRDAGAARVSVWAVARTPPPGER